MKVGEIYKHYKGTLYKIVALAKHSEDLSELVIYQDTGNPEKIWARPREMFLEEIEKDGQKIPRFQLIEG